ncbi:putative nuclease HARBI1 [Parasteatoda tepidariorum]|uniref:putative nuclease HARBI1 n=1 Tax=Parasteatoda tepidariorum TaxID=114398 RepID=UPI0039BCB267
MDASKQLRATSRTSFMKVLNKLEGLIRSKTPAIIEIEVSVDTLIEKYNHSSQLLCVRLISFVGQDFTVCMSQQSVSNCILSVSSALNSVMNDYIRFPLQKSEQEFYDYSGFCGVTGAIDCTHIAIIAPKDDDTHREQNYVNQKNFHSLNVQLVVDMQQNILNISARFPGSSHDSYIWKSSDLRRLLQQAKLNDTWLLGDSGYPLDPWLLTPISGDNLSSSEEEYNRRHVSGSGTVERCNGTLKSRFRCLLKHRVLNYSPETAA